MSSWHAGHHDILWTAFGPQGKGACPFKSLQLHGKLFFLDGFYRIQKFTHSKSLPLLTPQRAFLLGIPSDILSKRAPYSQNGITRTFSRRHYLPILSPGCPCCPLPALILAGPFSQTYFFTSCLHSEHSSLDLVRCCWCYYCAFTWLLNCWFWLTKKCIGK